MQTRLIELSRAFNEALLRVYGLQFRKADAVTLAVFGENSQWLFELARQYYEMILTTGATLEVAAFVTATAAESEEIRLRIKAGEKVTVYNLFDRITLKHSIQKASDFLFAPQTQILGIALRVKGALALPRYEPEWGLHSMTREQQTNRNLVHTSEGELEDYVPPAELKKRGSIRHQETRREYNRSEGTVVDHFLEEKFFMQRDDFKPALQHAIEKHLIKNARALLEE